MGIRREDLDDESFDIIGFVNQAIADSLRKDNERRRSEFINYLAPVFTDEEIGMARAALMVIRDCPDSHGLK